MGVKKQITSFTMMNSVFSRIRTLCVTVKLRKCQRLTQRLKMEFNAENVEMTPEVQFFGANSLHMKIARFWHELPPEQIAPLRSQLIQLVVSFVSGPRMVLTRLCVTLSSFLLQTMPEHWPDAVPSLVAAFDHSNMPNLQPSQADAVLFEILTVLPEEFITSHLLPQRKGPVRNELQKALGTVVPLLQKYFSSEASQQVGEQALRCFSSWAQFGLPLTESESLVSLVFDSLRIPHFFDAAIEALVHFFSHPDNDKFIQSMQRLLMRIVNLEDMLHTAMINSQSDMCQGLCKLIVIAADHNISLVLGCSLGDDNQRHLSSHIIGLILCTDMPGYYPVDECCSDFPFGFWYNFQDDLLMADTERRHLLMELYVPVFMRLVDVLLKKVQFPPDDEYNSWDAEEKESHRCYRQDIADALMYLYNLLQQPLLSNLALCLEAVLERARTQPVPWQEIEAVLFALTSLAEGINSDDIGHLAATFSLLPQIPNTNYTLIAQALYFIGAFSEWMVDHPQILVCALPLLLQGLKDNELVLAATLSLKEVLRENQSHLMPFSRDILNTIKQTLDSNTLKPSDEARLYWCLGYVLSILPLNEILEYLGSVLTPCVEQMKSIASSPHALTVAQKAVIVDKLNILSFLFCSLNVDLNRDDVMGGGTEGESGDDVAAGDEGNRARILYDVVLKEKQPQPVLYILQQIFPVIQLVLQRCASDTAVVTGVCEMFKHALRTLMMDFAVLFSEIASLILQTYQTVMHPGLLDLAKQMLVLFVNEAQFKDLNQSLFAGLCNHTLSYVNAGRQKELTDIMEALMSFLAQITKKNVGLLRDPSCNLVGLYQAGVIGLLMHETPTSKASCQFLTVFLSLGQDAAEVKEILSSQGHSVVMALVKAISGETPRSNIDPMADVLLALNRHHFSLLCKYMNDFVAQDGFPNVRVSRDEKEQFARKILTERTNKRKLKEVIQEYTLLWRGLINTEYGAQTSTRTRPSAE